MVVHSPTLISRRGLATEVMTEDDLVLMGVIGAAHGIRGEVRIRAHTDDPLAIADYSPLLSGDGGRQFTITKARMAKNMVVATLEGVSDRNQAEALNGTELFVERSRLPGDTGEGEFYHTDLIGLTAVASDGEKLGTVIAVPNYGAGDLIEIAPPRGKTWLVPFTKETVPEIDLDIGQMVIVPPVDITDTDEDTT